MKLTASQERMLLELAESNKNDDGEWAIAGRGQVQTCDSLARLGLAKRHASWGAHHRRHVFSLTPAGRERARELTADGK